MATYGAVVEGPYDEAAIKQLIRKCISSDIKVIARPCKGSVMKKFSGFLEEFRCVKQGMPVDKALVIRDADNKVPDELLERMKSKIAGRTYPFEVKFIIIVQELETLFLADEGAISRVTQARSGKTVTRVNETLEAINQPKERLYEILSDAGVPYTEAVAREIAKELELSKIEYRCLSFRNFRQDVVDC